MDIQFKTFRPEDPAYKEEYDLRNRVLRHPLGLDLKDEDLSRDREDIHLGGFLDGSLAALLLLHPLGDGVYQMRQVCVAPETQGKGYGRKLVEASEALLKENGGCKITLHARQSAAGFYLKLGYRITGEGFTEIGIPHFPMEKDLR